MDAAQTSFISSTFWTDRIGSAAALRALEVMNELRSWETITKIGERVRAEWKNLSAESGVDIVVSGIPAISSFSFKHENSLACKTFLTQEMLKGFFSF